MSPKKPNLTLTLISKQDLKSVLLLNHETDIVSKRALARLVEVCDGNQQLRISTPGLHEKNSCPMSKS